MLPERVQGMFWTFNQVIDRFQAAHDFNIMLGTRKSGICIFSLIDVLVFRDEHIYYSSMRSTFATNVVFRDLDRTIRTENVGNCKYNGWIRPRRQRRGLRGGCVHNGNRTVFLLETKGFRGWWKSLWFIIENSSLRRSGSIRNDTLEQAKVLYVNPSSNWC